MPVGPFVVCPKAWMPSATSSGTGISESTSSLRPDFNASSCPVSPDPAHPDTPLPCTLPLLPNQPLSALCDNEDACFPSLLQGVEGDTGLVVIARTLDAGTLGFVGLFCHLLAV